MEVNMLAGLSQLEALGKNLLLIQVDGSVPCGCRTETPVCLSSGEPPSHQMSVMLGSSLTSASATNSLLV